MEVGIELGWDCPWGDLLEARFFFFFFPLGWEAAELGVAGALAAWLMSTPAWGRKGGNLSFDWEVSSVVVFFETTILLEWKLI